MAKNAGMKYITITSKHHDGFRYVGQQSIRLQHCEDKRPMEKTYLKMLADECHKEGIKLFFYHSQLDWHHPDYFPRGYTGQRCGPVGAESGNWSTDIWTTWTLSLPELLTDYGDIWPESGSMACGIRRMQTGDWTKRISSFTSFNLQPW